MICFLHERRVIVPISDMYICPIVKQILYDFVVAFAGGDVERSAVVVVGHCHVRAKTVEGLWMDCGKLVSDF